MHTTIFRILIIISISLLTSCGSLFTPQLPSPENVIAPTPIEGSSGEFMSPFTADGTVTAWVETGMSAKLGSAIGSTIGAYAGAKALEQIPLVGGFLGQKVGDEIGRQIAIESMGGEEVIKEGSDLSFSTAQDLSIYIYAKHSTHPDYAEVVELLFEIYPEVKENYIQSIVSAPQQQNINPVPETTAAPSNTNKVPNSNQERKPEEPKEELPTFYFY